MLKMSFDGSSKLCDTITININITITYKNDPSALVTYSYVLSWYNEKFIYFPLNSPEEC